MSDAAPAYHLDNSQQPLLTDDVDAHIAQPPVIPLFPWRTMPPAFDPEQLGNPHPNTHPVESHSHPVNNPTPPLELAYPQQRMSFASPLEGTAQSSGGSHNPGTSQAEGVNRKL
ncbi:hypothetical protein RhiJN_23946 [Ceratobasidium sp. AG-Ba]|nr:hypothetical protein RhiJN_23946 [Ceratobasidium sp. AG-Ba]